MPQTGGRAAPRAEPEDRRPDVLDRLVEVVHRALEPARDVGPDGVLRGALHVQTDREQALDHHVVQVPGDALALLEHREPGTVGLRLGDVQGERELLGEPRDARQVDLRSRVALGSGPARRERRDPALGAAQRDGEHPDGSCEAEVDAVAAAGAAPGRGR